ncbi:putative calcium-binding protein CML36 [Iris pallida]|uniref:Calcium-binding protein CML36 n=1 Tax=Iris pallida TaxID=29817 RepID=A0AAX6EM64_IRIPA|nr:putative calcium-binding protein CML36 [Iris pallida]
MKIITSFKKPSFLKRSKTGSRSVTRTFSGSGSEPESLLSQPTPTSVLPPSITTRELELLLRRLGPDPMTDEEVITMLSEADRVGGGGSVSYDEIESLGAEGPGSSGSDPEGELRETFRVFDADGDGRISAEELMRVLGTTLGSEGECTLEECEGMIRVVGSGGDGSVCFEDFVRMMTMGLER